MCLERKDLEAKEEPKSDPGHPVQIIKVDNGRFGFDIEALRNIVEVSQIGGHLIYIISVNGNARSGKSFLLNAFIRQAKQEDPDNGATASATATTDVAAKGFPWKGGIKSVTSGMWIWSKPLITKDKDGRDIAVLLMDTQGLVYHKTETRENQALFWLSCMLSSTFIFNVKGDSGRAEMEVLQSMTSLIMMKYMEEDGNHCKLALPKLVFTIRDWVYSAEFPFGMHSASDQNGKIIYAPSRGNFMEYFLSQVTHKDDHILSMLQEKLSSIKFCLLPFPGINVSFGNMGQEMLKPGHLKTEFVKYVNELTEAELQPNDSGAWRIGNKEMTGNHLLEHFANLELVLDSQHERTPFDAGKLHFAWQMMQINERNIIRYDDTLNTGNLAEFTIETMAETHELFLTQFRNTTCDYGECVGFSVQALEKNDWLSDLLETKFEVFLETKLGLLETSILQTYSRKMLELKLMDLKCDSYAKNLDQSRLDILAHIDSLIKPVRHSTAAIEFIARLKPKLQLCYVKNRHIQKKLLKALEKNVESIFEHFLQKNYVPSKNLDLAPFVSTCVESFVGDTIIVQDEELVGQYVALLEEYLEARNCKIMTNFITIRVEFGRVTSPDMVSLNQGFDKFVDEFKNLLTSTFGTVGKQDQVTRFSDMLRQNPPNHYLIQVEIHNRAEEFANIVSSYEVTALKHVTMGTGMGTDRAMNDALPSIKAKMTSFLKKFDGFLCSKGEKDVAHYKNKLIDHFDERIYIFTRLYDMQEKVSIEYDKFLVDKSKRYDRVGTKKIIMDQLERYMILESSMSHRVMKYVQSRPEEMADLIIQKFVAHGLM